MYFKLTTKQIETSGTSEILNHRVANPVGTTETTARLHVRSPILKKDEEKPRVVRGLKTTLVEEGQTLHMDCVMVGKPEPTVTWFKVRHVIIYT